MFTTSNPQRTLRNVLLGATAALAIGGALQTAVPASPALALTQTQNVSPLSFADTVEHVRGAVVSVKVKVSEPAQVADRDEAPRVRPGDPLERFFRQFGQGGQQGDQSGQGRQGGPFGGNGRQEQRPHTGQAQGSGFIISADGYVVTNNHVVENATDVSLTLDDGRSVAAKIIGTDKKTDLALLKITDGGTYPFVSWSGASPRVGDWVVAIGNPFGLGGTVTAGIVSARGRDIGSGPYDDYLQIDAPVNRGNSGGPTFNANGEVVGVNTAIYSPSGGSVGIGFAIPAEVAKTVIASLKDTGSVSRGWIGVQIQPVTPEIADSLGLKSAKGALIAEAVAGGPAVAAGLRSGDVITSVDAEAITGPRELSRKIAGLGPQKSVEVGYLRDGAAKTLTLHLGAMPAEKAAANETGVGAQRNALTGFGLALAPAGAGKEGVVIADVDPDGAAAQKGLKQGDVILEAAGKSVSRPSEVASAISAARKDGRKSVLLRVRTAEGVRFVALAFNAAG